VVALISTFFMKEVPLTGTRAGIELDEAPDGEVDEEPQRAAVPA
jgi:hypothetical protein